MRREQQLQLSSDILFLTKPFSDIDLSFVATVYKGAVMNGSVVIGQSLGMSRPLTYHVQCVEALANRRVSVS